MNNDIYESLMDICGTIQTLKEQIETWAYSFIPEDENSAETEVENGSR